MTNKHPFMVINVIQPTNIVIFNGIQWNIVYFTTLSYDQDKDHLDSYPRKTCHLGMILSHPVMAMVITQLCIISISGYCIMDIGMVLNLEKWRFNQET